MIVEKKGPELPNAVNLAVPCGPGKGARFVLYVRTASHE
jgi:hypothetical protein